MTIRCHLFHFFFFFKLKTSTGWPEAYEKGPTQQLSDQWSFELKHTLYIHLLEPYLLLFCLKLLLVSYEPRHHKTNKISVRPAKTQINLGIHPVWSESSLSAWRKIGFLATHWAHSEDSDQTADAQADLSLYWAHRHFAGFAILRLKHFSSEGSGYEQLLFTNLTNLAFIAGIIWTVSLWIPLLVIIHKIEYCETECAYMNLCVHNSSLYLCILNPLVSTILHVFFGFWWSHDKVRVTVQLVATIPETNVPDLFWVHCVWRTVRRPVCRGSDTAFLCSSWRMLTPLTRPRTQGRPEMYRKNIISRLMTKPTNWHVRPAKTQISLGIGPVWTESSLCAQWIAKDSSFLHADNEDSDQTGRMPRLIRVFAGSTLILLLLSWGGSKTLRH